MRRITFAALVVVLAGCQTGSEESPPLAPSEFKPDELPGMEEIVRAAADGDLDARYKVAVLRHYMMGDYEPAIAEFRILADSGHMRSIRSLGYAYMFGKGVAVDYERAAYWLEKAADLGDEQSAQMLAAYRAQQE